MKKLLALTLTMAMLFTMTAMAEEIKTNSHDVTATYKEGTDGGDEHHRHARNYSRH